jgi:transposase
MAVQFVGHDTDGFWLFFKRLEKGHFEWPKAGKDSETMTFSSQELAILLGGARVALKIRRNEVTERLSM